MLARYLVISCTSFAAVLSLFAVNALNGQWTWVSQMSDHLSRHVPQLSAQALPIPIAFLLWVQVMEKIGEKFTLVFSPFFCVVTIEFLTVGQGLVDSPSIQRLVYVIGVVSALFVTVPFGECARRARRHPRVTCVAVIAAAAAINYYWLMLTIWKPMGAWTFAEIFALLNAFHMNITGSIWPINVGTSFIIQSPNFGIRVDPSCNGLEGIFLFNFMLSVLLLVDWDLFKERSLVLLYGFGVIYMFVINVLRISLFFSLGYWAYRPDAGHWMSGFRGAPLQLFHSYLGWVIYLQAFGLFAAWIYRRKTSKVVITW